MAQEFLNRSYIVVCLKKMRGEAMTESMYTYKLGYASDPNSLFDGPLQDLLAYMVTPYRAGLRISRPIPSGEHVLPCPFEASLGILPFQCKG